MAVMDPLEIESRRVMFNRRQLQIGIESVEQTRLYVGARRLELMAEIRRLDMLEQSLVWWQKQITVQLGSER